VPHSPPNVATDMKRRLLQSAFDDDDTVPVPVSATAALVPPADDEEDPLDAFMTANAAEMAKSSEAGGAVIVSDTIDGDDDNYNNINDDDNDDKEEEEESGTRKSPELPPVDHSFIEYKHFQRIFYTPPPPTSSSSSSSSLSQEGGTVSSFAQLPLPSALQRELDLIGFASPTPVQAKAVPLAMSGRDLLAVAKTGSGKTVAFLLPMLVHILAQPQMTIGVDGPIALILCPTRELATQIFGECKKVGSSVHVRSCCVSGGTSKYEMQLKLKEAPEVVVATPGRLIDLVRKKATNLRRVTYLVLDEADRMLDMGFEGQTRSIVANIRPDAQRLLFSATMKRGLEAFALSVLNSPVRLNLAGAPSSAAVNSDIRQSVVFVHNEEGRWAWLAENADAFTAEGKLLVFVKSRLDADAVAQRLQGHFEQRRLLCRVEVLHGERSQSERDAAMRRFSRPESHPEASSVLVATDLASRGLHVDDVRTVVSFHAPSKVENHVHRIGRTGRMGAQGQQSGEAITLLGPLHSENAGFLAALARNLSSSGQHVPPVLAARLGQESAGPPHQRQRV